MIHPETLNNGTVVGYHASLQFSLPCPLVAQLPEIELVDVKSRNVEGRPEFVFLTKVTSTLAASFDVSAQNASVQKTGDSETKTEYFIQIVNLSKDAKNV